MAVGLRSSGWSAPAPIRATLGAVGTSCNWAETKLPAPKSEHEQGDDGHQEQEKAQEDVGRDL